MPTTNSLLSQNGIEDYVHSNVLNMSLSVYWDKLSWLHYKLSSAGNISWKGKDAFSQSNNALHNFYSTMHADVFPFPQLRLYADCSIESFEISHGNYSSNSSQMSDVNGTLPRDFHCQ